MARMQLQGMMQAGQDPGEMMLPTALVPQILYVWRRMGESALQQAQQAPPQQPPQIGPDGTPIPPAFEPPFPPNFTEMPFTQFMATVRAHRILGEGKKSLAQSGPVAAAPGGAATTAGTEPVLGSTAQPGTGTAEKKRCSRCGKLVAIGPTCKGCRPQNRPRTSTIPRTT
jgi:hypothetical protein